MAYLGNEPATGLNKVAYQDLTGGSGTGFTLDQPVGDANQLAVFVNNVRQEPGVAYTASGTTLTMTGTIASTDDFYVVFNGLAVQTGVVPEKQSDGSYVYLGNVDINGNELILDADGDTSITSDTDDQIDFKTAGSDAMHLTSTGLGIGTSSPDADLSLTSPIYTSGGDDNGIRFQNQNNNGDAILQSYYSGTTSSALLHGANIYLSTGAAFTPFDNTKPNSYILQNTTGSIEFGNASTGTATQRVKIHPGGRTDFESPSGQRCIDVYRASSTSSNHIANFYSDVGGTKTVQQVMEASGDIESRTGNLTGTSDRTLKENIVDATAQWDDIKALDFKNFNFIGEPDRTMLGVIAQDVQAAGMTGLVKTNSETGKLSVKYSVMFMKAVIALQEAMTKIETLETEMTSLKARVQALENA